MNNPSKTPTSPPTRTPRTGTIECFAGIDTIRADPGNPITWVAAGPRIGKVSIWVPDDRVFGKRDVANDVTLPFEATVDVNVPDGIYEYAIFDHDSGRFVVGRSHPKIEIPGP